MEGVAEMLHEVQVEGTFSGWHKASYRTQSDSIEKHHQRDIEDDTGRIHTCRRCHNSQRRSRYC